MQRTCEYSNSVIYDVTPQRVPQGPQPILQTMSSIFVTGLFVIPAAPTVPHAVAVREVLQGTPQIFQTSIKTVYVLQDYSTYLLHRLYHTPWLYKKFHKAHHKYVQPTAFSVTAIHPFEIVHTQLMAYCMPLFVFPTHWSKCLQLIHKSFVGLYLFLQQVHTIDHKR